MKLIQFLFSTLFTLGLFSVLVFPGSRTTKIKILVFLTKLNSKMPSQFFELFFMKFFESLDASLLEASFHRLGATRLQVSKALFGFTLAYLESLPALFSQPSLMVQPGNQLPAHVQEIFTKAQSVTVRQLVKQGMTSEDAFVFYSRCSTVALPRLTDFARFSSTFILGKTPEYEI
jgi:hypothetical protein